MHALLCGAHILIQSILLPGKPLECRSRTHAVMTMGKGALPSSPVAQSACVHHCRRPRCFSTLACCVLCAVCGLRL